MYQVSTKISDLVRGFLLLKRESEEDSFDWFKTYADIADIIRELVPDKNARILMLGCGNSTLSEEVRFLNLISSFMSADVVRIEDV